MEEIQYQVGGFEVLQAFWRYDIGYLLVYELMLPAVQRGVYEQALEGGVGVLW